MAISLPQKRPMSRRDCHATLAMTAWQKLGTREIPIADHRRSADPLPTEPVPPQHRSTHHHQQRAPSGVQRRCCHKRRRELHGRRRNPRTTHPRDVNRRRGHRPTLRPSHRPPQQLLQRLVRHRPRGTRTTRHRDLTRQAADVGQRVTALQVATADSALNVDAVLHHPRSQQFRTERPQGTKAKSGRVWGKLCQPRNVPTSRPEVQLMLCNTAIQDCSNLTSPQSGLCLLSRLHSHQHVR